MLILKKALCMLSTLLIYCRYSSVVEHVIGNDGVVSPILTSGTIKKSSLAEVFLMVLTQLEADLRVSPEREVGENEP